MNTLQQPREYDAVLGGNVTPESAAVLGGIEGVKLRLQNPDIKVKIIALQKCLDYGKQGLQLLIDALKDESVEVQNAAFFKLENYINLLLDDEQKLYLKQVLMESESYLRIGGKADYTNLRKYLLEKQWKAADTETMRLMLFISNREKEGWLDTKSLDIFPCRDLQIIDYLWLQYSNGKFAFSVQKRVFERLGGMQNTDWQMWYVFADKIGWKKGEDIKQDVTENGYFPFEVINSKRDGLSGIRLGLVRLVILRWLFSRCETCKI